MASLEIDFDIDFASLDVKNKILFLDKLFFKILASNNDLDFEENLAIYLSKLIEKLSTNEELVRKKVMEILVHINKRVKSRPNVQLPLNDLLFQFNQSSSMNVSFVVNFSLIYIKIGVPRLDSARKGEIVERLLLSLDGKSSAHQETLLSLVVDCLKYLDLNRNNSNSFSQKYSLVDKPILRKRLLDYLLNYLLLPYELSKTLASTTATSPAQLEIPACMSEKIFKQFKQDINLDNVDELEQSKVAIIKFLSLDIYTHEEVLYHFIIASSDTRYTVVQIAELHIKRIASVDWNELSIVNRLYTLFLGERLNQKVKVPNDNLLEPANTRIRLKLFPYILRSRQAANTLPQSIQLIFDCLFGTTATNSKIKLYTLQFVHQMALFCDTDKLVKIGAVLIQGLNKILIESKEDGKLRGLSYIAIGKLSKRLPNAISNDVTLVRNFFNALAIEELDIKLNVQEALVLMIDAFKQLPIKEQILKLLFEYIQNDVSQCRAMCVKYAFDLFESDHLESRFLLLLATSDSKEDIRQDAIKYLRRTHDYDGVEVKVPDFKVLVQFISTKANERIKENFKTFNVGSHTLPFEVNTYFEILVYLRLALSKSSQTSLTTINLKSIEHTKDEAPKLKGYFETLAHEGFSTLLDYLTIVKNYAIAVGNSLGIYLLLEISAILSERITKYLRDDLEWIKSQVLVVNDEIRFFSAELWSIIFLGEIFEKRNFDEFFSCLKNMKKTFLDNTSKTFEQRHGIMLSIGYSLARFYRLASKEKELMIDQNFCQEIKLLVEAIISKLDDHYLSSVAIVCLGEIARNGSLQLDLEQMNKTIDTLHHKILTSNETNKVKEKAILTLGYICVGSEMNLNRQIMEKLLNSTQTKQIELHMTLGESLVNSALGAKSSASRDLWTCSEMDWRAFDDRIDELEWLLNELLTKYIDSSNPHLRQAASFWLLMLVKKCSHLSASVRARLEDIQDAFVRLLGDNDEVTQDVASKGIGLCYSLAKEDTKNNLVGKLVDTLSGNKKKVLKIRSENEEVFKQEQLGKTPDGQNIGTYKELCSLASDLNKPDLVYQFMNLAHQNSMWNTRRGAAFGFQSICKLSSNELQQHLPHLIPKLYRYQFDPNIKIQQSMQSIWNSIMNEDNKKIIDQYLDVILGDLEANMLSPLWRIRESCCLAFCDLIKGGRNLEPISAKFGTFWSLMFKLADDIKESVRNAAELALRSLNRVTIAYSATINNLEISEKTVNSVLPILIKEGLNSSLQQVTTISVKTIHELTKQSQSAFIKPYLVELIVNLLETLSGYESSELNYLSLKLNSTDLQETLDQARVSSSKSSPMLEIINMNVQFIDSKIMERLVPKLVDIIKKGLGVSTKAGLCHLLVTLINQSPEMVTQYTGKFMAALVNSLAIEPNKTIRKAYCNCLGCIVKIAKDSSIENLLTKLQEWYFEKDDDGLRLSCGLTLWAISQNNHEIMLKHIQKCAPFIFFAMHQTNNEQQQKLVEEKSNIWMDLWEETTSGTEYAIKTHLKEIINFIRKGLEHQSWKLRIQASCAICTVFNKLQSKIEIEYVNECLTMLNNALITRFWSGKHHLFLAVSSIFRQCKLLLNYDNEQVCLMLKNVFKETIKTKLDDANYKICSLKCLADLLEFSASHFRDVDFEQFWLEFIVKHFDQDLQTFDEIQQVILTSNRDELFETIKQIRTKNNQSTKQSDENTDDLDLTLLETLGKAWPYSTELQDKYFHRTTFLLSEHIQKFNWNNQLIILKSLLNLFDKWSMDFKASNKQMLLSSIDMCVLATKNSISKSKYSNLKRDGLCLLETMLKIFVNNKNVLSDVEYSSVNSVFEKNLTDLVDDMRLLFEELSMDSQTDIKDKSRSLLKLIILNF